jgi:Sigma-70, region 4
VREAAPHLQSNLILDAPIRPHAGGGSSGGVSRSGGRSGGGTSAAQRGRDSALMDLVADGNALPEEVVNSRMMTDDVRAALHRHLTPRASEIVAAKFGLDSEPPMRSTDIAERYGISPPRVHQIVNDGLAKIRKLEPGLASWIASSGL